MKYSLWVIRHRMRPLEYRTIACSENGAWKTFERRTPVGSTTREMWDITECSNELIIYVDATKLITEGDLGS